MKLQFLYYLLSLKPLSQIHNLLTRFVSEGQYYSHKEVHLEFIIFFIFNSSNFLKKAKNNLSHIQIFNVTIKKTLNKKSLALHSAHLYDTDLEVK